MIYLPSWFWDKSKCLLFNAISSVVLTYYLVTRIISGLFLLKVLFMHLLIFKSSFLTLEASMCTLHFDGGLALFIASGNYVHPAYQKKSFIVWLAIVNSFCLI